MLTLYFASPLCFLSGTMCWTIINALFSLFIGPHKVSQASSLCTCSFPYSCVNTVVEVNKEVLTCEQLFLEMLSKKKKSA